MKPIITNIEAIKVVKDGDTIMVGGFGPKGYPGRLVRALNRQSDAKDLTFIVNATNPFYLSELESILRDRSVSLVSTFIRGSEAAERMYNEKTLDLSPQGTFAERLRAGGVGIPAFYTPVGIGTEVAEGKEVKVFDGKEYLLEKALNADVAFIRATQVDMNGNCYLRGSMKNLTQLMPAAARYTIVEAEEIVPVGGIDPENISIPGIHIDAIVRVGV